MISVYFVIFIVIQVTSVSVLAVALCLSGCKEKVPEVDVETGPEQVEETENLRPVIKSRLSTSRSAMSVTQQSPQHQPERFIQNYDPHVDMVNMHEVHERLKMQRRKDLYYVLLTLQMQQDQRRKKGLLSLPVRFVRGTISHLENFIDKYDGSSSANATLDIRSHPYYKKFIAFNDCEKFNPPVVRAPYMTPNQFTV